MILFAWYVPHGSAAKTELTSRVFRWSRSGVAVPTIVLRGVSKIIFLMHVDITS